MRVITNGCFDCFHTGHMHILLAAIKFAGTNGTVSCLINSDKSIRSLKGPGRPVLSVPFRMDAIVNFFKTWKLKGQSFSTRIFDSETKLMEMIQNFRPDLIVKGSDRPDVRTIVGHEDFPVVIVPRLLNISTTQILKERNES